MIAHAAEFLVSALMPWVCFLQYLALPLWLLARLVEAL